MKRLLFLFLSLSFLALPVYFFLSQEKLTLSIPAPHFPAPKEPASSLRLKKFITAAKSYIQQKGLSEKYQFYIDMNIPPGKKRFFVYDAIRDSIIHSGLVAHGSCRSGFLEKAVFSNVPECGCSSDGKYKISYAYNGQFGKAFKLHGMDSTNSNAFKRTIVLHGYSCIPDEEVYPMPICNSLGCPMVSYSFLEKLSAIIERSEKPILLWLYK